MNPFSAVSRYFAPPPPTPRRSADEVAAVYPSYRWQMLQATFLGYATYYLVRNNLAPIKIELQSALGLDKSMLGNIGAATAISYGIGKFFMGVLSDRSDARKFMTAGLVLSALCNFAFGAVANYPMHLFLWSLNGLAQGMGWPPCGRTLGHWFSESERGLKFSIWNTSHNFGGAIAGVMAAWAVREFGGWQYAFYVPGAISLVGAAFIYSTLRDTPQSVGLPPIEEYRNDYPAAAGEAGVVEERDLTVREILIDKVLLNPWVWLLAAANFFAYITRYSMLDWGPTYLREVKGASLEGGAYSTAALELGGIPSTIALGWLSDKLGGRRGMVASLCMIPIVAAFTVILYTPKGYLWLDMTMLFTIGFFIDPVINLITIAALDIASKKAIGAAAGFIGLLGYLGRTVQEKGFGWAVHTYSKSIGVDGAWDLVLYSILACGVLSGVLLAFTWKMRPRA
ncbi:MAG: MFS transporter [Pirellulales bacterium]|nr:MFS transporter [Pirellulales bacterium]